jgi:cystathionine beta-lyase/cystathionine gamma-synthase
MDMHDKKDQPNLDKSLDEMHQMRTRLIHGPSRSGRWDYAHHVVPPITSSATFRLDSVERGAQGFGEFAHDADVPPHPPIYIYDRLDEPTRGMLEENLQVAEGGEMALCFASGMAAISSTIMTLARAGEHVIAHEVLYGCTYSLLTSWVGHFGIDVSLVDLTVPSVLEQAITDKTRVVYFESPVNPDLTLIDITRISDLVARINKDRPDDQKVRVVVDNTFATPYCQRPISLGADVVCLSLTKGIGGFGTAIGGAVVGPKWLHDPLIWYRKDFGGTLAPQSAWSVLVHGLPTLATRMVNYQKTAKHVAEFLLSHPAVEQVRYPGMKNFPQYELARQQMRDYRDHFAPGCMIYFVLKDKEGSGEPARILMNWIAKNSYCMTLAVSLGQIKTLIEAPFCMTHAAMPEEQKRAHRIAPSGCRLSVGLEDRHDLVDDLKRGLDQL